MGRKSKRTIVIEGPDSDDPFGGLKKLLQGFCDPRHSADDETTLASQPMSKADQAAGRSDRSRGGVAYGLSAISIPEWRALEPSNSERALFGGTSTTTEKKPELKATHVDSNLRRQRGLEVFVMAVLAVCAALYALRRLGYSFDFSVIDSQMVILEGKKWINIVYNDDNTAIWPGERTVDSQDAKLQKLMDELKDMVSAIKSRADT